MQLIKRTVGGQLCFEVNFGTVLYHYHHEWTNYGNSRLRSFQTMHAPNKRYKDAGFTNMRIPTLSKCFVKICLCHEEVRRRHRGFNFFLTELPEPLSDPFAVQGKRLPDRKPPLLHHKGVREHAPTECGLHADAFCACATRRTLPDKDTIWCVEASRSSTISSALKIPAIPCTSGATSTSISAASIETWQRPIFTSIIEQPGHTSRLAQRISSWKWS